jgi:uncharacterized integral membrane protein
MLRRIAFGIVLASLAVAGMLFTALNQQVFDVDIAFATFEVSSGLALLIAFSAGLLAGAFVRSRWVAELLAERGRLRHALRLAEGRLGEAKASSASATAAPTPTTEKTPLTTTATPLAETAPLSTTVSPVAETAPPSATAAPVAETAPPSATATPVAETIPTTTTTELSR